jgi:ribosomal protein L11 methylase PrmA
VQIGSLWIGPPWEVPPADVTAVVIEPARAFGTGAQPTTQLCVQLLLALDSDEHAVAATRANAAANGVEVEARLADIFAADLPPADVALANITRTALESLATRLDARWLVSSGYLPTDPSALEPFRHVRRITREGWAADLYERAE